MCLESLVAYSDIKQEAPVCLESFVAYSDIKQEAPVCLESLVAHVACSRSRSHQATGAKLYACSSYRLPTPGRPKAGAKC
jgi:hypothetical protein